MKFLFTVIVFGATLLFISCSSKEPPQVTLDEYEVYSAVLNHYYIDEPKSLFSLSGEELKTQPKNTFDQIIVNSKTSNFFSYGLSSDQEAKDLPQETLMSYLQKNSKIYELENNFELAKNLVLVDEELLNKELKEYRAQGASNPLTGKYPRALGWLFFSRVGFSDIHDSAIVSYLLKYPISINLTPESSLLKTIFLIKEDGKWMVRKSFPRNEETIINVHSYRCDLNRMGYSWGQGSGGVEISGREQGKCQLTESHEVEGGYKRTACQIPENFGWFQVFQFGHAYSYSKNLSQFCDEPKQGNLLVEQAEELRKSQRKQYK